MRKKEWPGKVLFLLFVLASGMTQREGVRLASEIFKPLVNWAFASMKVELAK